MRGRLLSRILALLLAIGGAAAQTLPAPGPPHPAASPTPSTSPTDALIAAIRKSWLAEARGEAVLELVFPPGSPPLRRARKLPRLEAVPALIRRNFTVTVSPDTRAGRPALRYALTPNNAQAARWTIWVDQQWKVPLAYQEQMPGGPLARRAELLSVTPPLARLPAAALPQRPGAQALRKALLAALPGLRLPSGFEPQTVRTRAGAAGDGAVEVLLSDGLNVLALVVSPRAVQPASGVAVRRLGGQAIWLVGNLPQGSLADALNGIRRLDRQAVADLPGTFAPSAASDQ